MGGLAQGTQGEDGEMSERRTSFVHHRAHTPLSRGGSVDGAKRGGRRKRGMAPNQTEAWEDGVCLSHASHTDTQGHVVHALSIIIVVQYGLCRQEKHDALLESAAGDEAGDETGGAA